MTSFQMMSSPMASTRGMYFYTPLFIVLYQQFPDTTDLLMKIFAIVAGGTIIAVAVSKLL